MRRVLCRITGWSTVLAVGALAVAVIPDRLSAQGTLPEWGRPLSPAEGRALRAEIAELSRQLGVREATLTAIARVLGANLRNVSFPELVQRIQSQAQRAAELQSRLGELRPQIAALTDTAVREPAEQALARATAAFNEGRLGDADREFVTLESLRHSESEAAQTAWMEAVNARGRIAELRFDFDAAERIRMSAARGERLASSERQWSLVIGAAEARRTQGDLLGDNAALERAIQLYREALTLLSRRGRPSHWAVTQYLLGTALLSLGAREQGSARLEQALHAYEIALQEWTRSRVPLQWALAQSGMGQVLFTLGEREVAPERLTQSVAAFEAALGELPAQSAALQRADAFGGLAAALLRLGERESGTARFEQAVAAYGEALRQWTRERFPVQWATAQHGLGNAYFKLAEREANPTRLNQAAAAYRLALQEWTRERAPLRWATAQSNIGNVFLRLGVMEPGTVGLEEAVRAYEAALQEWTRARVPLDWAAATSNLAGARALIGERRRNPALLDRAEQQAREAREVMVAGGHAAWVRDVDKTLGLIAQLRRKIGS